MSTANSCPYQQTPSTQQIPSIFDPPSFWRSSKSTSKWRDNLGIGTATFKLLFGTFHGHWRISCICHGTIACTLSYSSRWYVYKQMALIFPTRRCMILTPLSIPFSVGPRNCVGQPLATAQLKVALAHLVHRYNIRKTENSDDPIKIVLITIKAPQIMLDFETRQDLLTRK